MDMESALNSDIDDEEEGILEDDSLDDLNDVWDEELNDDLLRSDEEDLTTSGGASHLENEQMDGASHHAEEPIKCTGDQQAGEELDHGEVFDIQINGPLGDEFQELARVPVRQQKEEEEEEEEEGSSTTKDRDEESCGLHLRTERKATATVMHLSNAASEEKNLTEALGLCEEARLAFWGHLNKLGSPARGRSGTQMDTQFHSCNGCPDHKAQRETTPQSDHVCSRNAVSSLPPLPMELQSAGASLQQVPLTSTQSLANPAVDPSSLQVITDFSRPLNVQTNPTGIQTVFPGQHMFGQQLPASVLDSSPLHHGPVPMGAAGRPGCLGDPRGPRCSTQRNLGLPSPNSTHPVPLCVPRGASLQPASTHTTHSALHARVPSIIPKLQLCENQHCLADQGLSLSQTQPVLHHKQHGSTSSASFMQAPLPARLPSLNIESQTSPLSRPASLCCAIIKPRMQVQSSPNVSRVLSDRPVLAHNSSFINMARPTPTPAAQVRPVARAVATGMPGAARQQASARAGACARAVPEPVLAGKSRGQEVKEEPQSPLSLLFKKEKEEKEEEANEGDVDSHCQSQTGEDEDGVPAWYRLQLEKQKCLRQKLIGQKEERRHLQAQNRRKQRQENLKNTLQKHDQMPERFPQPPQASKQAQNIQKSSKKTIASNVLPPLRPSSTPGYPPAPFAQCPAASAATLVRHNALEHGHEFPGHGFHGRGHEGSGGFSGVLGVKHGKKRKTVTTKRVVRELPYKVRVVKHSCMEENEGGVSMRFPARMSEGSRVVTFTQIPSFGSHTLRQVCPNARR